MDLIKNTITLFTIFTTINCQKYDLSQTLSNRLNTNLQNLYQDKLEKMRSEIQGRTGNLNNNQQRNPNSDNLPNLFPNLEDIDYGCFCRNLTRIDASSFDEIDSKSQTGHAVDEFFGEGENFCIY